jgi:hypothetical protein
MDRDPPASAGRVSGSRLRRRLSLAAAAILIATHYGWALPSHLTEPGWLVWRRDFSVYHQAARSAWAGQRLYVQTLPPGQPQPMFWRPGGYFYPPVFAVALGPLGALRYRTAWWIWRGFCELFLLAGIAACVTLAWGRFRRDRFFFWWVVTLVLPVTWRTEWIGQLDPLLLLLAAGALVAARRRREGAAGALLGVATLCKLYPAVLLAYLAWRRRWRSLAAAALVCLLATAAALQVVGWAPHRIYLTGVLPLLNQASVGPDNASFYAAAGQMLIERGIADPEGPAPPYLTAAYLVYALIVAALVLWRWRDARRHTPRQSSLAAAAGLTGALLVLKLCWSSYSLLLLLPAVLLWEWAPELAGQRAHVLRGTLVAAWACLTTGACLIYFTEFGYPYTTWLMLAAAWIVFALALHASGKPLPGE